MKCIKFSKVRTRKMWKAYANTMAFLKITPTQKSFDLFKRIYSIGMNIKFGYGIASAKAF